MTRWLDDDEQRTWRSFLATSELLYGALDRQLQRDAGITHASYGHVSSHGDTAIIIAGPPAAG